MTPIFVSTDSEDIVSAMVVYYEGLTGKSVQPGQAEMLLINTFAYREKLIRQQINSAGLQMLVPFSTAPVLDELAKLVGVTRLSASSASCTLEFTLVAGHPGVVIPANTRVRTTDGKIFFSVESNLTVAAGVLTATVLGFASEIGKAGNDYAIGTVTNILDPVSFVESAQNTTITGGGADQESDEELRERIIIAPSQYTTAGPRDSYKFHAKSASPSIIDVGVGSSTPGTVQIYPLVEGGIVTPPSILQLVEAKLNGETIRPLSDTPTAISPTITNYTIEVEITTYVGIDPIVAQQTIEAALNAYKDKRAQSLGLDIRREQISALSIYDVEQIFDVDVIEPAADLTVAEETEVAVCTGVTVSIIGTSNG